MLDTERIRFKTVKNWYTEVSREKALMIARRLYKLSKDYYKVELINRRFIGIEFTEEEMRGKDE